MNQIILTILLLLLWESQQQSLATAADYLSQKFYGKLDTNLYYYHQVL